MVRIINVFRKTPIFLPKVLILAYCTGQWGVTGMWSILELFWIPTSMTKLPWPLDMKMCLSQFENHHHRLRYKTLIWLSCFLTGIWWYWPRNVRKTPDESFCLPGEETGGTWPLLDWDRNCSLFPCSYTACLFPGQRSTLPSGLSRIFVLLHVLFYLMVVHLWLPYFLYHARWIHSLYTVM